MSFNDSFIKEDYFRNINLEDKFFNSLKSDYSGFKDWFRKKSVGEDKAFISKNEEGLID